MLRLYSSKQNGSMWKTNVVVDLKFTKLLVSTILVLSLAPEMNSTLTSPRGFILVLTGQSEVIVAGYIQGWFHMYTKPDLPLWPQWWCKPRSCASDTACVQFCLYSDSV